MATGKNDSLWCSVMHLGAMSLWLKVLLCLTRALWRGREPYCSITHNILLSDTAVRVSSSTPTASGLPDQLAESVQQAD